MKSRQGMLYCFAAALSISTAGLIGMPKQAAAANAFECYNYDQYKYDQSWQRDDHIHGTGTPPVPNIWEYEDTYGRLSDDTNHSWFVVGKVREDNHTSGQGCGTQQ